MFFKKKNHIGPTVTLTTKAGQSDYAACAGTYNFDGIRNGKLSFMKVGGDRYLGWNGKHWGISNPKQWPFILTSQNWGAFHASTNGDVGIGQSGWKSYDISVKLPPSKSSFCLL